MLTVVILSVAAFAFALGSIAAISAVAGAASRWPSQMFSYLMWMLVIAGVGGILISGRVLRIEEETLVVGAMSEAGGTIIAKLLLSAVIGVSIALCVTWILLSRKRKAKDDRFEQRGLNSPDDIMIAFMVFYVAFSILPLIFGKSHQFHVSLFYPFFVFTALFLWMRLSKVDPIIVIKQCLGFIVLTSLVVAVLIPQLAVQPSYVGLIPGFNSRLWGLTTGANSLGSVAGVLLVLEAAEPSARRWLSNGIFFTAAVALVLTQSKTSILAAFLGLLIIFGYRLVTGFQGKKLGGRNENSILIILIAFFVLFIAAASAWVMFFDTSVFTSLERNLDSRAVGRLATASGRTWIWEVAVRGGMENPLFGQGLGFWSLENRLRWGLLGAAHAHNLFLDVFVRSGLVGLTTLLVFLYFVFRYSIRATRYTHAGSIALAVIFLVRATFEVPLQPNAILGAESMAMLAYFLYVIDRGAKRRDQAHEPAPRPPHFLRAGNFR
ncbi:MAG: O-antigen ligase family protein [Nitrosospira multiformis]|nr:O-antigen ligase family protein [Nitrosospira multiformis]